MKKYIAIKYYLLIAAGLLFESCNKNLEQISQSVITDAIYWKTSADLVRVTNYLYISLPDFGTPLEDRYSDFAVNITTTTIDRVSDGSREVPANDDNWTNNYRYIRAANNIILKSSSIPDDPMKTYCIAQARFFRALAYSRLVRVYGNVPYIDRTITGSDDEILYTSRNDRRAVVDSIYADLDFAAANSPQADALPGSTTTSGAEGREYGRITRSAALALKSRVALNEGSWHKFHSDPEFSGPKEPGKHFLIAQQAALMIMNEGKHSLYVKDGALSYQNLFRYQGEGYTNNKENILVRLYGQNVSNSIASQSYMRGALTDGQNAATRAYILEGLYADGLPAGKSAFDKNGLETGLLTDFENRDPRLPLTIFKVGDPFASINGATNYGNTYYYHQQKYWTGSADFFQAASGGLFLDFIAIRYAEVLLNYAEATYEINGNISDGDLDISVNLLRNRATNNDPTKLPLLTNAFVMTHGLDMRNEIRRERSIELAFEGFRYWDLLRWKTAETELPKSIIGRKYFSGINYGGAGVPQLQNGYVLIQNATQRKFNVSKDYLWPLPSAQIGLSKGSLEQNPNWK
ncbi:RagB/SusD family nutrient uptake outer membrane protein [Sphingobacterium spiritivorum]|uniref:RagB/SusD family nutrient uptake outer membrane protein n=1 Tax=Sphingobacterium spiritivorum TaxID=258 RepID=UPI001918A35B|nr:RagB/SusD family nutrient uptake outer membrane protein [Sphingobacterium spiritivorum]QQT24806.1 RagB/SusD family nutrient uptake outer membrane protein [Sphingobacterium spiritivorum]